MPEIQVPGARLYYEDSGGGGAPVVFSHGLLWSTGMWRFQVAAFRGRHRCVSYDHRGQGRSEVTVAGYDMDTLAEDAAALIEEVCSPPVVLVGLADRERRGGGQLAEPDVAAQQVDGPPAGDRPEPGAGPIGYPVLRPLPPGGQQRVLDNFLGGVEIPQDARHGRGATVQWDSPFDPADVCPYRSHMAAAPAATPGSAHQDPDSSE